MSYGDCRVDFRFPVVKLHEYRARWAELEANTNPFATVVMAHLLTQDTQQDELSRQAEKLGLIKRLYRLGIPREQLVPLLRFIDWLMRLPEGLERELWQEVQTMEEEQQMPYVSSLERLSIERGMEKGLQQGLQQGLQSGQAGGSPRGRATWSPRR